MEEINEENHISESSNSSLKDNRKYDYDEGDKQKNKKFKASPKLKR